jgi:N6-adenosine-specific RNA methylase IME4
MDPATRFEVYIRETGLDRSADNHYPTEVWEEIAGRVPPLADDGILACWTTRAQLMNTGRMIEDRWGLEYKTCQGWGKPGRGTGYTVIDNLEVLIIAARGRPVWPAPGTQPLA